MTGAYGYSGRYIAARLLERGREVHTITNSPHRANPFQGRVTASPFHFDDLAELAVREGEGTANTIIDAIGPETFTFRGLVKSIGQIIGKPRPIVSLPPALGYLVASLIGKFVGDVFLTRQEISGLMRGLLATSSPPAGKTRLTEWAKAHADELGSKYSSELARRKNRTEAYEKL